MTDLHSMNSIPCRRALAYAYKSENFFNKSLAVAEMADRLATIDMGQKVGAAVPLPVC